MRDPPLIAIVDDDASVCRALTRLIRAAGMDTRGFSSADSFHATLRFGLPDCLVLDVEMPSTTGLQLQERLAREGCSLPIIFVTAHDDDTARTSAVKRGAVGFLRKPFDEQALLSAIHFALHRPKTESEGVGQGRFKPTGPVW